MTLIERYVPEVAGFRDDQKDYFEHLLSSQYGWDEFTGFIMPSDEWRDFIGARLRKAAQKTLRNRP